MEQKKNRLRSALIGRYKWVFAGTFLFAVLLIAFLYKTTVVDASAWNKKAMDTILGSDTIVQPERGRLLAADGSILAVSARYYDVRIDFRATSFRDSDFVAAKKDLALALERTYPRFKTSAQQWEARFNKELKKSAEKRTRTFSISKKMTQGEYLTLLTLPYFNTRRGRKTLTKSGSSHREKPFGKMAARSIGSVHDNHGSSGLERAFDSLLYGKPGKKAPVQTTSKITSMAVLEPQRGCDIKTTIDVRIQDILETELYNMCLEQQPEWATAVLMEVQTGDIKAISNLSWDEYSHDYIETVNQALRSWELGSVMKPISIAIAIQDGYCKSTTPVNIGSSFPYASARPITDTHSIGANPTVTEVIAGSSNIGTARIITNAYDKAPWTFRERLKEIGFFDTLNIGLSGEAPPRIQELGRPGTKLLNEWRINLSRCCYGYAVQTPPIHNLAIINAIANDGKFVRPRLVSEIWRNDSLIEQRPVSYVREQIFSPEVAAQVRAMLKAVVWSDHKGVPTAPRLQNNFVTMAGKTGTARIFVPGSGYSDRLRLTFTGFFPYENPRYSCIVVFNSPNIRSAQLVSGRVAMNTALKMYARGMLGNVSDFKNEQDNTHSGATLMAMAGKTTDALIKQALMKDYKQYRRADNRDTDKVPSVIGMGLREAVCELERRGMVVTEIKGRGYVTSQIPAAGTAVKKGMKVTLQMNNW